MAQLANQRFDAHCRVRPLAHDGHVHLDAWENKPGPGTPRLSSLSRYRPGAPVRGRRLVLASGARAGRWTRCPVLARPPPSLPGWLLAFEGALVTPLHWLGERLFTAHMIEHEVIMLLSAPVLVVARPLGAVLWALPQRWRQARWGVLRRQAAVRGTSGAGSPARSPRWACTKSRHLGLARSRLLRRGACKRLDMATGRST